MRTIAICGALLATSTMCADASAQRVRGQGGRTPGGEQTLTLPYNDDASCPSNRIRNGGFDIVSGSAAPTVTGLPVADVPGWNRGWTGPSTTSVFAHAAGVTMQGLGYAPVGGLPGNHLAINITNANPNLHENGLLPNAALGQLAVPITPGTGNFTLRFRTSAISGMSSTYPSLRVAIYAVRRASNAALPPSPAMHVTPNVTLYGGGSARRIGFVDISPNAGRAWQQHIFSFNSATLATADDGQAMGSMTHLLIIGGQPPANPPIGRVIGFDAFCLQNPNV